MSNTRLVYSTDSGRICAQCRNPVSECHCKKKPSVPSALSKADGIVRIQRQVKGRKGKTVTTLQGFDLDVIGLGLLAKKLKQHCGSGGTVKDGTVVIQGDHREKVKAFLEGQGYTTKLAGG
ncbi:MAG TPA: stress response translation initiation inhibitor YciH [Desulfobacterales bacterium]